ncbi:unnamed protein product [Rhizoctonia solani]|uniref:AB hydrolase-1 domain-containing protein n=1 Tax=Rhizoctonia solani TaxID=456999 RepID=A0A8H3CS28_9AGAM|nr:unnamed protein product [Rhizoctonia solani]
MSFNLPSFVPNQISATLRSLTDRGFRSPLNIALVTAIPLIALYSRVPAISGGVTKPKVYPSLGNIVLAEGSRLGKLKKHADEIYPPDIYGPSHTAELTKGEVRYWLLGSEEGKRVILIHGLSIPSLIWKEVATRLAKAGFRVLLFDLYGRGYTEAPDARTTRYDVDLYITQLALLMQFIGWRRARIVGLSMGGAIAAAFAAKFPWLVDSNVGLIASVGVMEDAVGGLFALVFGSAAFQHFRHSAFGKILFTPAPPPAIPTNLSKGDQLILKGNTLFGLQSAILPGYTAAVAASVFVGPLRGLENEFKKLGKLKEVKVQIIWGTKDEIVPYKYAGKIKELIPHAELVTIDGAGHDLCASHYEVVSDNLIGFLRV